MSVTKTAVAAMMAMSMMAVPTLAQAAPQNRAVVSKVSVGAAVARVGAPVRKSNRAVATSYILAALAVVAVGVGIAVAADNNNSPTSA